MVTGLDSLLFYNFSFLCNPPAFPFRKFNKGLQPLVVSLWRNPSGLYK